MSLKSFNGHYMMPCDSVTGHEDCDWSHSMVIIWFHPIQYLVVKIVIEVIQWSLYDAMRFSNWSWRLWLKSFNGHYMMPCDSVTGHEDCDWSHSMVIIWFHPIQYLVVKIVIEVIQWSLYDAMRFSNWSWRLWLKSFNGHYMMPCDSVTGHEDCDWSHSMVIIWFHPIQ